MPDTTHPDMEAQDGPDVGGPVFIPISLIPDVSTITAGTTVNFAFTADDLPPNPTYNVSFYTTQSAPSVAPSATAEDEDEQTATLSVLALAVESPEFEINSGGGSFSVTFDTNTLPSPPAAVIVTIILSGQNSLGLCTLPYS